jgi:hypothetical protein
MKINLLQPTPEQRRYVYFVALAALAVLVSYHLISSDQVPVWIDLVGAVLGMSAPAVAIPAVNEKIAQGSK